MENPIFDELSFQIFEKIKSRKIVSFVTSYILSGGGVSQFWAKRLRFFSFPTFYPSPKGRRELKIKTPGVIFHGESDFRGIIFSNFWKNWNVKTSLLFVSPKIPKSKKSFFFVSDKSRLTLKIHRIVLRSFLMLNDQNQNDSVFFGNIHHRTSDVVSWK